MTKTLNEKFDDEFVQNEDEWKIITEKIKIRGRFDFHIPFPNDIKQFYNKEIEKMVKEMKGEVVNLDRLYTNEMERRLWNEMKSGVVAIINETFKGINIK